MKRPISEGKSASLLEQERPNVFSMNIGNILPGDEIKVVLRYTELLIATDGVYEFIYPTVVGPRYSNSSSQESYNANPYTAEGEAPLYDFGIEVAIHSPVPVADISVSSHKSKINYLSAQEVQIGLDESEVSGGNRDFILHYSLRGEALQSGLMLYQGEEENFFLLMSQPPKLEPNNFMPRDYLFIVDVSGSMDGFPLDTSKVLIENLLSNLNSQDRFNILFFAGGANILSEKPIKATANNIRLAKRMLSEMQAGGGTELLPALRRALNMPRVPEMSRNIVIITDGYVTVEKEAFDLLRNGLNEANVFSFGIGSSVNRFLIEGLARVGQGEAFVVTHPEKAAAEAERFRRYIASPVLSGLSLSFDGFEAYELEPPTLPDVMSDRPVIAFGKWRGEAKGNIILSGHTAEGSYRQVFDVADGQGSNNADNAALRYLWARKRIELLGDYQQVGVMQEDEITALGLQYNLLTDYTSFVAIDSEVRAEGDVVETVRQPLPLPEGVSNSALPTATAKLGRMNAQSYLSAPPPSPMAPMPASAAIGSSGPSGANVGVIFPSGGAYPATGIMSEEAANEDALALSAPSLRVEEASYLLSTALESLNEELITCYSFYAHPQSFDIKVSLTTDAEGKVNTVSLSEVNGPKDPSSRL
ncbi:MAG: VWA domain-containing protein [Deinococcales bacterium]